VIAFGRLPNGYAHLTSNLASAVAITVDGVQFQTSALALPGVHKSLSGTTQSHYPARQMLGTAVRPPAHATLDNAADFAWQHDDIFGRIATRYDLLCDVLAELQRRMHEPIPEQGKW
jgi:hypothetical protein